MSFLIKGCTIKIDFYFIFVLAFAALSGAEDLLYLLLYCALHELGHLTMLLICGGRPKGLTFSYYGFALRYEDNLPRFREAVVIISGPLVNLLLYFVFKNDVNLILFLLNILPVYPLDGGRILKLYFHTVSRSISIGILICIYILSVYLIINSGSFSLLLIALYLTIYSLNYY